MNRFITLKNVQGSYDLINAQHIITAENMYDGKIQLRVTNGMKYVVDESEWCDIVGHNHVVQIVPCVGLAAEIVINGTISKRPISVLAITASGEIRPMNERLEFMDSIFRTGYRGVVPYSEMIPEKGA